MSADFSEALASLLAREPLGSDDMRAAFESILGGKWTPVQIGAFAIALRMLGETPDAIAGAAEAMRGAMAQKYGPLAALNELQRRVQVKRSERTYVVDVSVTSEDPAKAARIANAIAQTYLAEQTEVRSNAARQISQLKAAVFMTSARMAAE